MGGQDDLLGQIVASCFHCGTSIAIAGRIGRRDTCGKCGHELRCCRNCRFYDPTLHNSCREPQAERQVDKERANFCEYFALATAPGDGAKPRQTNVRSRLEELFRRKES